MPGAIQSIERAAAALRLLASGPRPLTLQEVSGSLGLAKATTHGILRTLVDVGFVDQDRSTGRYEVGAGLVNLPSGHLDGNTLRSYAINWADTLAARTGETVKVGMLVANRVEVVHHVFRPDDAPQRILTGQTLPLHATALGKILLAHNPAVLATVAKRHLEPCTHRTMSTSSALVRQVAAARLDGTAAEVEELTVGEASVAAPVRGRGGLVVAALGVSGSVERLCDGQGRVRRGFLDQVRDVARVMSREFGG